MQGGHVDGHRIEREAQAESPERALDQAGADARGFGRTGQRDERSAHPGDAGQTREVFRERDVARTNEVAAPALALLEQLNKRLGFTQSTVE